MLATLTGLSVLGCAGKEWSLGEEDPADDGVAPHPLLSAVLSLEEVTLVDGIAEEDVKQDDPTLSVDQLELYFCATREGGVGREDIWLSTRDSVDDAWGEPRLVEAASSAARETAAAIAPDGLTLWFASDREDEDVGDMDVWSVTRPSREASFGSPLHLTELSGPTDDLPRSPALDFPFLPLVVKAADTGYDIFLVPLDADEPRPPSVPLPGFVVATSDGDPTFSPDGLLMIFASDRDDEAGDLYVVTRASLEDEFGPATPLSSLNTDAEESDPWLAPDGRLLFFSSARDGRRAIYQATAP